VRDLAVVGLLEVVKHLRKIRRIYGAVLREVDRGGVDLAVLVDYPDFNLPWPAPCAPGASGSSTTSRPSSGPGAAAG
jgi:hypothetical protein